MLDSSMISTSDTIYAILLPGTFGNMRGAFKVGTLTPLSLATHSAPRLTAINKLRRLGTTPPKRGVD